MNQHGSGWHCPTFSVDQLFEIKVQCARLSFLLYLVRQQRRKGSQKDIGTLFDGHPQIFPPNEYVERSVGIGARLLNPLHNKSKQQQTIENKMMSMASHRLMAASARNAARQLTSTATRSSTTVASTAPRSQFRNPNFVLGIGSGLVLAGLHSATGSANDFYDYRFKSPKDADDLASFYGGEELMELYCVFPIVGQIMMRSATFDDTGGIKTQGFPGTMEVNMVFSDDVRRHW